MTSLGLNRGLTHPPLPGVPDARHADIVVGDIVQTHDSYHKTFSLVPFAKKSGPASVSRYCKAALLGINLTLFEHGAEKPGCRAT